jgi:glyoxylase-like metal-dependent hydrolase (beta-lactamase superfamily II)
MSRSRRDLPSLSGSGEATDGPDRRTILTSALAASLVSLTGLASGAAPVQAAISQTFKHGEFEVMVLSDGHLMMPVPFLAINADPAQLDAVLGPAGQRGGRVEPPVNVTLIRTKSDLILIDTGSGPHFMPTAGKLLASLESARIKREAITKVVYTHAHPDHIWGTLDEFDDAPNFPNAAHVIAAAEWNFWMADDAALKLPEDRRNFAAGAKRNLLAIKEKIRTVRPGEDIATGLRAVDTSGHTADHVAIEVVSGGNVLLVVGDALAHPVIAFAHPEWKPAADHLDADRAVTTRKHLLDRLANDRTPLIGTHLPFPGLERVERKGTAYTFVAGV